MPSSESVSKSFASSSQHSASDSASASRSQSSASLGQSIAPSVGVFSHGGSSFGGGQSSAPSVNSFLQGGSNFGGDAGGGGRFKASRLAKPVGLKPGFEELLLVRKQLQGPTIADAPSDSGSHGSKEARPGLSKIPWTGGPGAAALAAAAACRGAGPEVNQNVVSLLDLLQRSLSATPVYQ
ncbi:unnamed protein product, partial [Polarella glacialis]